jgi:hypothetical protein
MQQGEPRFLYCYRGDGPPTAEYYDWQRMGNAVSGRFRWFEEKDIFGYSWYQLVEDGVLSGGWWMGCDVPRRSVPKLPHVPGMVPHNWKRISKTVSPQGQRYFREHYPDPRK